MTFDKVVLARTLHQKETFMGKAFQGEAVVNLPRALNNADHGRLLLARRVNSFQLVLSLLRPINCILTQ